MSTAKRNEAAKTPPWGGDPASSNLSFGTWLRQQREVREIGLREIAESTKISLRYLEAFEQDRHDLLPPRVFSRGFLRQYANYVGLDPEEVVNNFIWAHSESEPDAEDEVEASVERQDTSSSPPWLLILFILLLLAAAIVALIYWRQSEDQGEQRERFLPPASSSVSSDSSVTQGAATTANQGQRSGAAGEGREGEDAAGPTNGGDTDGDDSAGNSPASSAAASEAGPSDALRSAAAASTAPLRVTLEFEQECWVELMIDNQRRISRTFQANEGELLEARRVVVLRKVGNAGGVRVHVNGNRFPLQAEAGEVLSNIRIDLETARSLETSPEGDGA